MHLRRLCFLAAVAVVAALAVPVAARTESARAGPAGVGADTVTEWNAIASNAIVTAAQAPHVAALSFAMVQGAVYDAVNAIDGGHRAYLAVPATNPRNSKEAAAMTAAFRVLGALFPAQETTLQAHYDASLARLPDGPTKDGGIAAGEAAAAAMLAARENDGRGGSFTFVFGSAPGEWRLPPQGPTGIVALDPAPWVANVRPFVVPNVEMLRTDPPNALTSAEYAEDFTEVKEIGSLTSTLRTADQTVAAIFWQDNGLAIWNRAVRGLSASQELDVVDNARLFAMVNLAAADGLIGCWNNKYYWNFWRPITAIREAATDGNPATEADPTWTPLFDPTVPVSGARLVTPGYPDHPAGHGCGSSAIVHTLQNFFGTDKIAFTAMSNKCDPSPCPPRSFGRFSDALKEIIDARVWAGIHFRAADVQGAVLGTKVAHYLQKNYFQPVG